jgi:hypothetical protein
VHRVAGSTSDADSDDTADADYEQQWRAFQRRFGVTDAHLRDDSESFPSFSGHAAGQQHHQRGGSLPLPQHRQQQHSTQQQQQGPQQHQRRMTDVERLRAFRDERDRQAQQLIAAVDGGRDPAAVHHRSDEDDRFSTQVGAFRLA